MIALLINPGLMRDYFTHKITTPKHWNMLMMPHIFQREELDYDLVVGKDTIITPSYDPHCENNDISGGCEPILIISAEQLADHNTGAEETAKIGNLLKSNPKMSPYVLEQEAWDCIWEELIVHGKGAKTVIDRPDGEYSSEDYNFSTEFLAEMIKELDRLISKYSSSNWNALETANRLVELIMWHRGLIQAELDELKSGTRKLTVNDFLVPKPKSAKEEDWQASRTVQLQLQVKLRSRILDSSMKERS
jgi:hypothetical protein